MIRRILQVLLGGAVLGAAVIGVLWTTLQAPRIETPQRGHLVFSHVTVVNPGGERRSAQTLVVDGPRIATIADDAGEGRDDGSTRRYRGAYVLPGLIDMHAHYPPPLMMQEYEMWDLLYLAYGVTTVRDAGHPDFSKAGSYVLGIRERLGAGEIPGPRVFTCGQILNGISSVPGQRVVRHAAEARAAVDDLAAAGVDCVKVYSHLSPEALVAIREAAARHGLPVIGHVPLTVPFADAHLDDAQHFFGIGEKVPVRRWEDLWGGWQDLDPARVDAIVQTSLAQRVAHTPTLVVWERQSRLLDTAARYDPVLSLLPRHWRELTWTPNGLLWFPVTTETLAELRAALPKMRALLHRLFQAGVPVHAGSDATMPRVVPGTALHEELQQFVQAGLSPDEAWMVATRRAGEWLGEPMLGTLQQGAPADMLLFREDPTRDLAALATLEAVVAQGRLYPKEWLDEALGRYRAHFDGTVYNGLLTGIQRLMRKLGDLLLRVRPPPSELDQPQRRDRF